MENVDGKKLGKLENPEKKSINSDTSHANYPPGDSDTRTRDPSRDGRPIALVRRKDAIMFKT